MCDIYHFFWGVTVISDQYPEFLKCLKWKKITKTVVDGHGINSKKLITHVVFVLSPQKFQTMNNSHNLKK